jgi:WD40 repeat protein
MKTLKNMPRKVINNTMSISILIFLTLPFLYGQDGQNKASVAGGGASFWLESLWSTQLDPRWKAEEVIGDVEDGITAEFVEFSADGKLLVSGNGQGEAFVLNATDGTIKHTFTYITEEEVNRLDSELVSNISGGFTKSMEAECGAFTPDGRFVVLGGNLNGIKIFDLTDGSLFRHIEVEEEVDGLSLSPDGRFFAHASFRSVNVLGMNNWEVVQNVDYSKDSRGSVVNSIHFTADGDFMAIAGNSGNIILINTSDWNKVGDGLIPDATSIKSVRFSPDERLIAAGNGGGEITVWRTWDMSLVFQFSSLVYIESVAWSSDGRYLFAGGRDDGEGRMLVFRTRDWQMVGNPSVLADGASIEYIDVHGDLIAIAGEDAHVRLYRIKTKKDK